MRFLSYTTTCTGTSVVLRWQTDLPSTATVQYGLVGGAILQTTISTAAYLHTTTISSLQAGVRYRFRIVAVAQGINITATSDWQEQLAYTSATVVSDVSAPSPLRAWVTDTGDAIAQNLEQWMAMARYPGAIPLTLTVTDGSPYARVTGGDWQSTAVGMYCTPLSLHGAPYQIASQPGFLILTGSVSGAVITVDGGVPAALTQDDVGVAIQPVGESTAYTITALSDTTITVNTSVGSSNATTWKIEVPVLVFDAAVSSAHAGETSWVATTVGRRVIEAIARQFDAYEQSRGGHLYDLRSLPVSLPWRGHRVAFPGGVTAASPCLTARLHVPSTNRTVLPLVRVSNLQDFLAEPAPVYIILGTLLLFHHLTMVEQSVTISNHRAALTHPIVPETTIWYLPNDDQLYGWRALDPLQYTVEDGDTLVLPSSLTGTILFRYDVAASADDPYAASAVTVSIDGRETRPVAHPLWNQFDELGVFLNYPRLWEPMAPAYHESNVAYRDRLLAAAAVQPAGRRDDVAIRSALEFQQVVTLEWDMVADPTLTLPTHEGSTLETVWIPSWPSSAPVTGQLLRHPDHSYILPYPAYEGGVLFVNGEPDERQCLPEQEEVVVPSLSGGAISFTLAHALAPGCAVVFRTRAGDWQVLHPDVYTLSNAKRTVTWSPSHADFFVASGPFTVRYSSTVGVSDGALPALRFTPTTAEWTQQSVISTTTQVENWYHDRDAGVLRCLRPSPAPVKVYCVFDVSASPLSAEDYLYNLIDPVIDPDSGALTQKALALRDQVLTLLPIVVGTGAHWDETPWFTHESSSDILTTLPQPWRTA